MVMVCARSCHARKMAATRGEGNIEGLGKEEEKREKKGKRRKERGARKAEAQYKARVLPPSI